MSWQFFFSFSLSTKSFADPDPEELVLIGGPDSAGSLNDEIFFITPEPAMAVTHWICINLPLLVV